MTATAVPFKRQMQILGEMTRVGFSSADIQDEITRQGQGSAKALEVCEDCLGTGELRMQPDGQPVPCRRCCGAEGIFDD